MLAAPPAADQRTALDRYVAAPDPSYRYTAVETISGEAYNAHLLEMTSQRWRNESEVDRPLWTHRLTVVAPDRVITDAALLVIGGGANDKTPSIRVNPLLALVAVTTGSVVAELRMVPNQPLTFAGESQAREDAIIAYSWDKYLRTGDEAWPLRLPMTKSVVRAMDAITALCRSAAGGGIEVARFVLGGASKRGWTAWTTAAVDDRVAAIVPVVIDLLNIETSFEHHYRAYGFWAPAIAAYQASGIMRWAGTPELAALLKIEDPFAYRDRLTMPKFVINFCRRPVFLAGFLAILFRPVSRREISPLCAEHRSLAEGVGCRRERVRFLRGHSRRPTPPKILVELRARRIDPRQDRDPTDRGGAVAGGKPECTRLPAGRDRSCLPRFAPGGRRRRLVSSEGAVGGRVGCLFCRADLPEPWSASVQIHHRRPGRARNSPLRPAARTGAELGRAPINPTLLLPSPTFKPDFHMALTINFRERRYEFK